MRERGTNEQMKEEGSRKDLGKETLSRETGIRERIGDDKNR